MKHKNIIWIVSLGLLILFAGLYVSSLKNKNTDISKSISLVPVDANILFEISDLTKLIDFFQTQPIFWQDLSNVPAFDKLNHNMLWLDSMLTKHDVLNELFSRNSLIVSIHDIGKHKLGSLFVIGIPDNIKTKSVLRDIEKLATDFEPTERTYESIKVYDVKSAAGKHYSYSIFKGNLFWSDNSLLIEDAIRQSNLETSILNDKNFKTVYATAGKKELANVYVNLSRLNHLIIPFVKPDIEENHPALKNYASWVELDMSLSESLISFNGFAIAPDTTLNYLRHIKDQSAISNEFESVLPENTALFYVMALDDNKKFSSFHRSYLDEYKHSKYFDETITRFNETCGFDMANTIYSLVDDQVCYALSNINQLDIFQNSYVLIKTKSRSKAEQRIRNCLQDYADHTQQEVSEYISKMEMDAANDFTVYRMPVGDWPEVLFGSFFKHSQPTYCSVLENTVVFASTKSSLRKLLNNYLLNRTINKNKNYLDFKKNLSRECQVFFYLNSNLAFSWMRDMLNDSYKDNFTANESIVKKHHIALQQIISDNMIYHNLVIEHSNYQNDKPHTIWESRLDTCIRSKPTLVENHYTDLKEIIVQDIGNTIYLINHKGHVLWKLPLDEQILGKIHQVDAYENGKLQYLFNTKNKIYLIDRLGNHVERFPVNLRSPATCGLALFDYDNTLDYRILVPCANKEVYLYNIEGNVVSGWEFEGTEYPVRQTPKHFRHENKDYIVFNDKYRIYILNRKGEMRVQPKYHFQTSKNNNFYFEKNENMAASCFVTTTNTGTIMKVFLNTVVDSLHIKNYSKNHYFMYKDMDADGIKDYIFLDDKGLEVYSQGLSMIMSYTFANEITEAPNYYVFSSDKRKIGVTDYDNEMIYLINADGTLHPGFPLTGKSPFSISYLAPDKIHFNLFVGGKNNFLYNYEIK
ncbi:MAG: DUF3352 domain-containing protein [Bacteroidota bacterium]|nr:DUF3352 domain-containing protein [Bacteroidota bacterium]